jgi:hypothetical protein
MRENRIEHSGLALYHDYDNIPSTRFANIPQVYVSRQRRAMVFPMDATRAYDYLLVKPLPTREARIKMRTWVALMFHLVASFELGSCSIYITRKITTHIPFDARTLVGTRHCTSSTVVPARYGCVQFHYARSLT